MPNIDLENIEPEYLKIAIVAAEPVSQGLDMIYAIFRYMSERMTQAQYSDFIECVKAILNNDVN